MELLGKIGFIGGGNMGSSLVGGLIEKGYPKDCLFVADHGVEKCRAIKEKWNIFTTTDPKAILSKIDILVLAVKPQSMKNLLQDIAVQFKENCLVISVAAGITTQQIQNWLNNPKIRVIRAMPNTPALLGVGATGLFTPKELSSSDKSNAFALLGAVGETVAIEDESLMDIVTALSGSGPAYFFYVMESLMKGAIALGLPEDAARKLTLHTALGSAQMALQSEDDVQKLREKVTSKGGTTEQGIKVLEDGKLARIIADAIEAATQRGKSLSEQFD